MAEFTFDAFKIDPSEDGKVLLLQFRQDKGDTLTLRLPVDGVAEWTRQHLAALAKLGSKQKPRAPGKVIPKHQIGISGPLEMSLSQHDNEPTLVMDYRVAALGFVVDRESLTHVLSQLLTRFPLGSPDQKH